MREFVLPSECRELVEREFITVGAHLPHFHKSDVQIPAHFNRHCMMMMVVVEEFTFAKSAHVY